MGGAAADDAATGDAAAGDAAAGDAAEVRSGEEPPRHPSSDSTPLAPIHPGFLDVEFRWNGCCCVPPTELACPSTMY
jgi:hypothetical protein